MHAYFTSDLHLGHANICVYCKRPYYDDCDVNEKGRIKRESALAVADRMTKAIVRRVNEQAKPDDRIIHIGDFCTHGYANGIEGFRKKPDEYGINAPITHILGNHDSNNGVKFGFDRATMHFGKLTFLLEHKPRYVSDGLDGIDCVLCGHVHDKWDVMWTEDGRILNINVGWDIHGKLLDKSDVVGIYRLNT